MPQRILVVDDCPTTWIELRRWLARADRRLRQARSPEEAMRCLDEERHSMLITEVQPRGPIDLEFLRTIRQKHESVSVLVLTGQNTIVTVVEAMKLGVFDILDKPADPDHLKHVVDQALEDRRLRDEVAKLRDRLQRRDAFHNLIGRSQAMQRVFSKIAQVAGSNCTVLITGETGTGKELVAQAIHSADSSRTGPLVAVNCAALPENLLESELFGHERGAFTDAVRQRKGRFEQAQGGTLLLDEVGELPLVMQGKLLRVLQEGRFERVGGNETIAADVRILAATNVQLEQAVAEGQFRSDLYYRLNVVSIEVPPLRDRVEDIPILFEHFQERLSQRSGLEPRSLAHATLRRLRQYDWPGNVRELEHLVEWLLVTTQDDPIELDALPPSIVSRRSEPLSLDFDIERPLQEITDDLLQRIERTYLLRVLEIYRGRIDRCAAHCGLSRRSISEKLRRYEIDKSQFKTPPGDQATRPTAVNA